MKITPESSNGEMQDIRTQSKTLADGTCVKVFKEKRKQLDRSFVTKQRTTHTYPNLADDDNQLKKSIKTCITRTDANGVVRSITTTKEKITLINRKQLKPNSTEMQRLPNGSKIISTKTSSVLADGSFSTVITTVQTFNSNSQDMSAPPPEICFNTDGGIGESNSISCDDYDANLTLNRAQSKLEVIHHNEAAMPSSFADYGDNLKLNLTQGQNKGQSKLEIIGDNADAVLPSSFASLPGSISCDDAKLKVNRGQNKRSGNMRKLERIDDDDTMVVPPIVASLTGIEVNGTMSKTKSHEELKNNKSKIETISPDRYSEPIPMSFYSSSATHPYRRMQHPFTSTKDGDNPRDRTSESQCRESMHVNRRTTASTADHCEPVDLENGPAHTPS
jgi:hypothetical protein